EDGVYRINNISANDFKLFALKDENSNYLLDQPTEFIGFYDVTVNPEDTSNIDVKIFLNQPEQQRIINTITEYPGRMMVVFSTPAGEISYAPVIDNTLPSIRHQ